MIRNLSQYLLNIIFCTFAFIIFALTLFPQPSIYAADVTLAWDANTESDLSGYYIYYKTGSSGAPYDGTNSPIKVPLANLNNSANPQYTVPGLSDTETTFFVVTAYDTDNNESGYSNEVSYQSASAPKLSSLSISGTDLVNESSNSDYVATAIFSNGSTQIVTESTSWSVDSSYAQINSSGKLATSSVPSDVTATIQATYTVGGVTRTASKTVTIIDIPVSVSLSSLSINGDNFINENSSDSYTATATFSNGSTQTVTSSAGWSEDSAYANINTSGLMTTLEVSSDTTVAVQATYTEDGITEAATKVVTIIDVPVSNLPPGTPVIAYPENGQNGVEKPLEITTEPFTDPNDDDAHSQSQWQISDQSDFSILVLDVISDNYLTTFPVPYMVLKLNQKYYVRVRFYDFYSESSEWSTTVEFTISSFYDDFNSNGIPDAYEVEDTVDFNIDGIPDNDQPDIIKCVQTVDGSAYIGVEKVSDSISEIEALEMIDPETISDTVNRPDDLIFGLIAYRLRVNQPGDIALVKIYFSEEVFTSDTLFKYDTINGWFDYSTHTIFNDDGQSVTLELKDGGYGDSDGLANGVIVDPSGIASEESTYSASSVSDSGSSGEGCFIATAAFGSKFEKHVQLLRRFRDLYLIPFKMGRAFVKTYYRYSPPIAEFIADHNIMRAMVRWSLIPLIGLSWMLLHFGIVPTLFFLFFISCSTLLCFKKIHLRQRG